MIAKATRELVANSSGIRAMFEEGLRMAEQFGKENVYDFSLGNPSVKPPAAIKETIIDILSSEDENLVHGYMNNAGYPDVRQKIAATLNQTHGTQFEWEGITMTVGAAGAMNIIFKTLLDPGDEVIVFAPFFGEYRRYIENNGGQIIVIPPNVITFQPDLDALSQAITAKTKAVIINSPNNPSGAVYTPETLTALADTLTEQQKKWGTTIYLVADEPYREIVYDGIPVPYVSLFYPHSLVAYSYSKSLSLPGERIGYVAVDPRADDYQNLIQGLNAANRVLGFVNAPSLFQRVVARCADVQVDVSIYEENKNLLYDGLTAMGYECVKPQGAFYLFPRSPIPDDAAFCNEAKAFHVLIVPGRAFGCAEHFRIAFCVPKETVLRSLDKFDALIKKVRYGA